MNADRSLPPTVVGGAVVVAFLWAICFPFIVVGLTDAPPLYFGALRALIAGAMLAGLAAIFNQWRWPSPREWGELALIGLSFTAIGFGGMFLGAGKLATGIATVLANVQPLIATVLAFWFLKEALTGRLLTGLLVSFAGVVVLAFPDLDPAGERLIGVMAILAGTVGTAVGNILLKRRAGGDVWLPMGLQLIMGSLFLAMASVGAGESWTIRWSWTFSGALLGLSVPATAIMVVLWYALLARAPLTRLNPFTFLTPAFGLLIGVLAMGERFSVIELLGVAITVIGLALIASLPTSREHAEEPT